MAKIDINFHEPEVMAIINSRPLTTEHLNDPTSLEPLTPNHILMMKSSIVSPPPGQFVKQDLYLRKRWRQVRFLSNEFWVRWRKEYLLNLQQRQIWQTDKRDTKVNDIVIICEDSSPRNQWKLARVTEVYPSADGKVRKVKLLVSDSTLDKQGTRTTRVTRCPALCGTVTHFHYFSHVPQIETLSRVVIDSQTPVLKCMFYRIIWHLSNGCVWRKQCELSSEGGAGCVMIMSIKLGHGRRLRAHPRQQ